MTRLSTVLVALATVLGIAAGLLSSRPASAVTGFQLYIQPGGASSYMTCGWHSNAGCPNLGGYGLDWSSAYGPGVWWRSYGVRAPVGSLGTAFPGDSSTPNGGCTRIGADVYSPAWMWRGKVVYSHAATAGASSFAISGGSATSPAFTSQYLGATVTSEGVNCPFGGQHLHQYNSTDGNGNAWFHNTSVYPSAVNPGNWDPYNWGFWQARTSWAE